MQKGRTSKAKELPSVSLIISNRNGRDLLRDCLASLMKQEYPKFEVIVIDAASDDGSPEMVEQEFPSVRLIRESQIGVGEAINRGMEIASGEIIAFDLNNDEIFPSTWLAAMVKGLLDAGRKAVVGGTRIIHGSDDLIDEAGVRTFLLGYFAKIKHGRPASELAKDPQDVTYLGCPMFWRELLELSGPCDTMYQFYFEDADFCECARHLGYKILNLPKVFSYHRIGSTFGVTSPRAYYYQARGRLRYLVKYYRLMKLLPSLLWWILFAPLIDMVALFPPIQRFLKRTRLFFLVKGITFQHLNATLQGLRWNKRNLRKHFKARLQFQALLKRIQSTGLLS